MLKNIKTFLFLILITLLASPSLTYAVSCVDLFGSFEWFFGTSTPDHKERLHVPEMYKPENTYRELQGKNKAVNLLPRGSALMTSSGDLAKTGIKNIIHTATGSMFHSGGLFEPTLASISQSINSAFVLARQNNFSKIAVPFIGGNIFLQRMNMDAASVARAIVRTAVTRRGDLQVKLIAYSEADAKLFQEIMKNYHSEVTKDQVEVIQGDITNFKTHEAPVIVNAANMEVVFGGGLSQAIAQATGSRVEINKEAQDIISSFYKSVSIKE